MRITEFRWDVPGNGVPTFYKRDCSEARAENGLCGVRQLPESWSYTGALLLEGCRS